MMLHTRMIVPPVEARIGQTSVFHEEPKNLPGLHFGWFSESETGKFSRDPIGFDRAVERGRSSSIRRIQGPLFFAKI